VFVVGYLGDWRPAAAVLFERHSMSGHPAPRREKGQRVADSLTVGANQCSGFPGDFTDCPWPTDIAPTLNAAFGAKQGLEDQHVNAGCPLFVPAVANAITASLANAATGHNKDENVIAFDAYNQSETDGVSKTVAARNDQDTASCVAQPIMAGGPVSGNQSGDFVVTPFDTTQISSPHNYSNPQSGDPCHPLAAGAHPPAVAFEANMSFATPDTSGVNPTLTRRHHASVAIASAVRRLTPRECERLQGFPDDWTLIPYRNKPADQCPDGPRYKALGNSMAVPVMRWIGERIAAVEAFNAP
jgi:DNA (cytosine-5)-methyltransferase 1